MQRSTERILTTHTGSLPRPTDLLETMRARESGQSVDRQAFEQRVREAVTENVRRQSEAGLDVVKLLALGARAVLIGRAWVWAVASGGQSAVRHMLGVIKADMDVALALTGHTSFADVDRSALYRSDSQLVEERI